MSYLLVKKSYVPGSPTEPWQLVQFVYSLPSAKRALRTKKFQFSRGDLFAAISAEYVSDIDHHVLKLWIATDDQTIVPAPPHEKNKNFDWIVEYQRSTATAILDYLYYKNRISYGYVAAVVLQCMKSMSATYVASHYFVPYVPTFDQWVAKGVTKDELLNSYQTFKADLKVVSHPAVRSMVSDFFLGILNKNSAFLFDVLGKLYPFLPKNISEHEIIREMIPLPEFLLLLIEKRTLKLFWE